MLAAVTGHSATKDNQQPDREMLRMMELLRQMELIKQIEMMQEMDNLEGVENPPKTTSAAKPSPMHQKEAVK
ncbi:MAG: hypothetical protein WD688_02560 [Candidatus Binatia bacterium]